MLNRVMRPVTIAFGVCITALALLAGCGGGGGTSVVGGAGSSGGGGGGTSGGGGGGTTADSRSVLLDSIAAKFAAFDGANPDNENQQLLAFMKTKSDFVDTGLSPTGGVWGRFGDGTTLVIANNVSRSETRALLPARAARSTATRAPGLPTSGTVVLGATMGSFWASATSEMDQWFIDQNYSPEEQGTTVDALKSLSNVGVLFLLAHGAACPIRQGGAPTYIVWTGTTRAKDGSTDTKYAADLQDGSLTYFMALTYDGDQSSLKLGVQTHYGITPKFVSKYWTGKFNPNSLVFIDACGSAGTQGLSFGAECVQAGASVYLGWTDSEVIRDGIVSAAYLFDRLLGANQYDPKESPPQRAFSLDQVLADMHARQRPYTSTNYDQSLNPKTGRTANLMFLSFNNNFQQLAPSIESLSVNEQTDELTVIGTFGDPKGDVYINNDPLTIKSWASDQIVCKLPRTGADASGDVTVRAGSPRQLSNTVQLTEWKGTIRCTEQDRGTLKFVMTLNVRFRTDVHERRSGPHLTPFRIDSFFMDTLDSTASYETSGTYVSPDQTYSETWSGSGTIPVYVEPSNMSSETNFQVVGHFGQDRQWRPQIEALALKANHAHIVNKDANGRVTSDTTVDNDITWVGAGDLNGNPALLTVGPDYTIPGGSVSHVINPDRKQSLEWSTMSPLHPPTSDSARSPRRG